MPKLSGSSKAATTFPSSTTAANLLVLAFPKNALASSINVPNSFEKAPEASEKILTSSLAPRDSPQALVTNASFTATTKTFLIPLELSAEKLEM